MITNISITPPDLMEYAAEARLTRAIQEFPEDSQDLASNAIRQWIRLMARDLETAARDAAIKGQTEGWVRYLGDKEIRSKRDMKYAVIAARYVAELFRIRGFTTLSDQFDQSFPADPKHMKFSNSGVVLKAEW